MKQNEIVIGKKYCNSWTPGMIYLGVGYRPYGKTDPKSLELVVIESQSLAEIGTRVAFEAMGDSFNSCFEPYYK